MKVRYTIINNNSPRGTGMRKKRLYLFCSVVDPELLPGSGSGITGIVPDPYPATYERTDK